MPKTKSYENRISGGAFIISRKIFDTKIWTKPPYYIKLWIWLLGKCNHTTVTKQGQTFRRGECLVTYKETALQTSYQIGWRKKTATKTQIRNFYEDLRKLRMVTTVKTTRGMLVKVLNYDKYQDLSNYENYREDHKKTTRRPQTDPTINKNDIRMKKNDINNGASPLDENNYEGGTIGHVIATKKLRKPKGTGITKAWQDQAFRFADALGIKLTDTDLKARWLKEFKKGTTDKMKQANIQRAYGYLVDYIPFQKLPTSEAKIKYFFWYLGNK